MMLSKYRHFTGCKSDPTCFNALYRRGNSRNADADGLFGITQIDGGSTEVCDGDGCEKWKRNILSDALSKFLQQKCLPSTFFAACWEHFKLQRSMRYVSSWCVDVTSNVVQAPLCYRRGRAAGSWLWSYWCDSAEVAEKAVASLVGCFCPRKIWTLK